MDPIARLEAQLVELQSQLAFQEDTLQTLNDIVTRQQDELDALRARYAQLEQQFEGVLEGVEQLQGQAQPQERPPHY